MVIMSLQLRKLTQLQTVYIGSAKRRFHLAEDEYKLLVAMLKDKYGGLSFRAINTYPALQAVRSVYYTPDATAFV